ncbi:hypothetical protein DACRYDRAFT_21323, partial [Dacryopinax primogenitus]
MYANAVENARHGLDRGTPMQLPSSTSNDGSSRVERGVSRPASIDVSSRSPEVGSPATTCGCTCACCLEKCAVGSSVNSGT